MVLRDALLVEELAGDAVREPLHVERPLLDVGECERRDIHVVRDEVELGQTWLREEQLLGAGDRNVVSADPHRASIVERVLEGHPSTDVTLEPLDDHIVVETLDESELPSGLIVPANEAAQCRTGIVAAVGPDVETIEPGDKVLFPRDAGYEVRLARSSHRVRVLKREHLIARISD
jgi:co-chaperonin GroES (HSP10)